jgi:uncharacterized membrane-anchored protein YhcB (DUF1043 family)
VKDLIKDKGIFFIWLLASVGIVSGLIVAGVVGISVEHIKKVRRGLEGERHVLHALTQELHRYAGNARLNMLSILELKPYPAVAQWQKEYKSFITHHAGSCAQCHSSLEEEIFEGEELKAFETVLAKVKTEFSRLDELRQELVKWHEKSKTVRNQLESTLFELQQSAQTLRYDIEEINGQVEIEQSLILSRFDPRATERLDPLASPRRLRIKIASDILRDELAHLSLIIARMNKIQDREWLLNMRENEVRPLLERIERYIKLINKLIQNPIKLTICFVSFKIAFTINAVAFAGA